MTELQERVKKLEDEAKRLWGLLDDISTFGDMYKPEHTGYFKAVNKTCERRSGMLESDGYDLYFDYENHVFKRHDAAIPQGRTGE